MFAVVIVQGMRVAASLQSDTRLVTASGDKTVAMFDTITAAPLAVFAGHRGSVKTCRPWDACPGVLASGARDGCVQVRNKCHCCNHPISDCPAVLDFLVVLSATCVQCMTQTNSLHAHAPCQFSSLILFLLQVWDARQSAGRGNRTQEGQRILQPVLTIKVGHPVSTSERDTAPLSGCHSFTAAEAQCAWPNPWLNLAALLLMACNEFEAGIITPSWPSAGGAQDAGSGGRQAAAAVGGFRAAARRDGSAVPERRRHPRHCRSGFLAIIVLKLGKSMFTYRGCQP